ncbi:hypothetical protein GQ600_4759 [Phytophthora cactorum]|nr:hypothetical protein GQ600_4759 [Phytophthora cactorum]
MLMFLMYNKDMWDVYTVESDKGVWSESTLKEQDAGNDSGKDAVDKFLDRPTTVDCGSSRANRDLRLARMYNNLEFSCDKRV